MGEHGRPTKYKKEYDKQAAKLCAQGFTDAQLADFFEVHESTINEWKLKHKSFSESLKAKRFSDDKVKQSLYQRCFPTELVEVKEESGTMGSKTVTTTKQVQGDTAAMIFWLKNRCPEEFRANPEVENKTVIQNIMPVPTADSADDWEQAASSNQDYLLSQSDDK